MRAMLVCAALLAALSGAAGAEARYDTRLEQAAMDMVARKIGNIRAGFDFRYSPDQAPAAMAAPVVSRAVKTERSWSLALPEAGMKTTTTGSIQTYSDGVSPSPKERRDMARKKVARIVNY